MFIAAFFTIAEKWTESKCPQADEWINVKGYIQMMENYSNLKRKF